MNKDDVLRVAGEPATYRWPEGLSYQDHGHDEKLYEPLYTEAQLLAVAEAMYAAGAEASVELLLDGAAIIDSLIVKSDCSVDRNMEFCNAAEWKGKVNRILALPIAAEQAPCDSIQANPEGDCDADLK